MDDRNAPVIAIGAQVRAARQARGWSMRAAAGRLGVSLRFLQELERGKATARLDKVVQVLGRLGLALAVTSKQAGALTEQVMAKKPLLRAIAAAHGARSLTLFGSAARGGENAQSDLDFLVELDEGRSLVDLAGLKQALEALFGRPVDAFTPASLKPHVLAEARSRLVRVL